MLRLLGLAIVLACQASAQFWNPFTWFRPSPPPAPVVVDCVLQPRDWSRSPAAEKKDWNVPCILAADIGSEQLANVKDTAAFLNARTEYAVPPTKAVWVNEVGLEKETPMNPVHLSTKEQADAILVKLKALNTDPACIMAVTEIPPSNPFSVAVYRDETRRHFYIGRLSVGLIRYAYAGAPKESVDRRLRPELQDACQ